MNSKIPQRFVRHPRAGWDPGAVTEIVFDVIKQNWIPARAGMTTVNWN